MARWRKTRRGGAALSAGRSPDLGSERRGHGRGLISARASTAAGRVGEATALGAGFSPLGYRRWLAAMEEAAAAGLDGNGVWRPSVTSQRVAPVVWSRELVAVVMC